MDAKEQLILALETGVGTGSMAILKGQDVLISERGGITRAEELLDTVDSALQHLRMNARDLNKVAVSIGPGSYTGIRIGVATAMGIARGVGTAITGVPILPALACSCALDNVAAVVPIGRSRVAVQRFTRHDSAGAAPPFGVESAALVEEIDANPNINYVASKDLHDTGQLARAGLPNLIFTDSNLADLVGRYSILSAACLEPIYL